MKKNIIALIAIGLLVVLVFTAGFLFIKLQLSKQQVIKQPINQTSQLNNQPNNNPKNDNKDYARNKLQNTPTPITLPYDYKVKSISNDAIIATSERGDITIRNDSRVQVFIGNPEQNPIPATFSDLKIGDMLILKRIPQVAAYVYIVNR